MKNPFPFPNKELAMDELLRDPVYPKLKNMDLEDLRDFAWDIGVKQAEQVKFKFNKNQLDFREIFQKQRIEIIDENIDRVIGNHRYFSEYITKQSKIYMYLKSIEQWASVNGLDFETAYNLILAHEYFHFLEYSEIGFVSTMKQIPILKIGKLMIGKTGIKALSEIGAHAFVNSIFKKEVII